jgi:hypothetical protein
MLRFGLNLFCSLISMLSSLLSRLLIACLEPYLYGYPLSGVSPDFNGASITFCCLNLALTEWSDVDLTLGSLESLLGES